MLAYIESNPDIHKCPTPDCKHTFYYPSRDPKVEDIERADFLCPDCDIRYCLKCKNKFHLSETC